MYKDLPARSLPSPPTSPRLSFATAPSPPIQRQRRPTHPSERHVVRKRSNRPCRYGLDICEHKECHDSLRQSSHNEPRNGQPSVLADQSTSDAMDLDEALVPAKKQSSSTRMNFLDFMEMMSPLSYRDQLAMHFISRNYPATMPRHREINRKMMQWFEPKGPAMVAAVDSMLLLHCARISNDERLRTEGRRQHNHAVKLLRDILSKPDAAQDDAVLGAIDALGMCGQYREVADSIEYWRAHFQGVLAIMRARGPGLLRSEFARSIIFNFLILALGDQQQRVHAFLLGEPAWQEAMLKFCSTPLQRLVTITCRHPAVYEKAGRVLQAKNPPVGAIAYVLSQLFECDARMRRWMTDWYASLPHAEPLMSANISTFPAFVERFKNIEQHFPFATALNYHTLEHAIYHTFFNSAMMLLRLKIYEVAMKAPDEQLVRPEATAAQQRRFLLSEVTAAADAMTRSAPFFYCQPQPHAQGIILGIVSSLARTNDWYVTINQTQKAEWAAAVVRELEQRDMNTAFFVGQSGASAHIERAFSGAFLLGNADDVAEDRQS